MYQQHTAELKGAEPRRFPADVSIQSAASPVAAIVEAQDNERARLARELHDSVGQKIAVLQMTVAQIGSELPSAARNSVLEVQSQISEIASELHAISHELYPSRLHLLGVAKAIAALCRQTSQQSGIDISFTGDDALTGVGPSESLCLYRIVQEGVQNIVKHSHARHATVRLVRRSAGLVLTVTDFGCGFDESQPSEGLGMRSMRQRAQLLNGTVSVHTFKSGGTRIRVEIPLAARLRRTS
jgi:signal transduction histidine kinase